MLRQVFGSQDRTIADYLLANLDPVKIQIRTMESLRETVAGANPHEFVDRFDELLASCKSLVDECDQLNHLQAESDPRCEVERRQNLPARCSEIRKEMDSLI